MVRITSSSWIPASAAELPFSTSLITMTEKLNFPIESFPTLNVLETAGESRRTPGVGTLIKMFATFP